MLLTALLALTPLASATGEDQAEDSFVVDYGASVGLTTTWDRAGNAQIAFDYDTARIDLTQLGVIDLDAMMNGYALIVQSVPATHARDSTDRFFSIVDAPSFQTREHVLLVRAPPRGSATQAHRASTRTRARWRPTETAASGPTARPGLPSPPRPPLTLQDARQHA